MFLFLTCRNFYFSKGSVKEVRRNRRQQIYLVILKKKKNKKPPSIKKVVFRVFGVNSVVSNPTAYEDFSPTRVMMLYS